MVPNVLVFENAANRFNRAAFQCAQQADPGIVDQHIDRPCGFDKRLNTVRVSHVQSEHAQMLGRCKQPLVWRAHGRDDLPASCKKIFSGGVAKAGRAASNQHGFHESVSIG